MSNTAKASGEGAIENPVVGSEDLIEGSQVVGTAVNERGAEGAIAGRVKVLGEDYARVELGSFDVVVCPESETLYRSIRAYKRQGENDGIHLTGFAIRAVEFTVRAIDTSVGPLDPERHLGDVETFKSRSNAEEFIKEQAEATEERAYTVNTSNPAL